jgi:uncharacterized protein (TIGR02594 family)
MAADNNPIKPGVPLWLAVALGEKDVAEYPGALANPRIVEYLKSTTLEHDPAALRDETPWCSAFVNWCFEQCSMPGTNSARARSWLDWGDPILLPKLGCVAVFSAHARGPTAGHVGFFWGQTQEQVHVYGGNQQNKVCLHLYERARLIGYRWPKPIAKRPLGKLHVV